MLDGSLITIIVQLIIVRSYFLFSKKPIINYFSLSNWGNNKKALHVKVQVDMHMLRYLDAP